MEIDYWFEVESVALSVMDSRVKVKDIIRMCEFHSLLMFGNVEGHLLVLLHSNNRDAYFKEVAMVVTGHTTGFVACLLARAAFAADVLDMKQELWRIRINGDNATDCGVDGSVKFD